MMNRMIAIITSVTAVIFTMLLSISITMSVMVAEAPVTATSSPDGLPTSTSSRTASTCPTEVGAPVYPARPIWK